MLTRISRRITHDLGRHRCLRDRVLVSHCSGSDHALRAAATSTGLGAARQRPLIDLALLIATAMHLRSGATAGVEHGVAPIYIGFSVTYGHRLIGWADVRFAHRFAGGPAPSKPYGMTYARLCWGDVVRTSIAAVIAGGLTALLMWWVNDPAKSEALRQNYHWLIIVWVIELGWAISSLIWPRRASRDESATASQHASHSPAKP